MATLHQLQKLLDFTESDLNANRRGQLSKAQIEMLQIRANQEFKALMLIPAFIVMWVLVSVKLALALPVLCVSVLALVGLISLHQDRLKDFKGQKVRKLSGQLKKQPLDSEYGPLKYVVSINGVQLPIERHLYEQLPEGKYTLYMHDSKILCMEPFRSTSTTTQPAKAVATTKRSVATANSKPTTTKAKAAVKKPAKPSAKMAKAKGAAKPLPLVRTRQTDAKKKVRPSQAR